MKTLLCCLFNCVLLVGFSQNYFDIANFTYTIAPQNNIEISDAQTTIEEIALELNFPVIINEKTTLLTGLITSKTSVKLDAN